MREAISGRLMAEVVVSSAPEAGSAEKVAKAKRAESDRKSKKKSSKRKDSSKDKAELFSVPYIAPGEIELMTLIGRGCFGKVYSGLCRSMEVAVKVPKKQTLSKRSMRNFVKEVEIMR